MGERTSYTPSTFCWVDLGTPDLDSAKAFYTGLFGWEPEDSEEKSRAEREVKRYKAFLDVGS